MASMVIRNIPDDVFERFKKRAKAEGKSAEHAARDAIARDAGKSRGEVWADIDALRAKTTPVDMATWQGLAEELSAERDDRHWHIGASNHGD